MKRKALAITLVLLLMLQMAALSVFADEVGVVINYGDAESFEMALNRGENLEGKIVQFEALELHPRSAFGYNIWAGEHLNFISYTNPNVNAGDTVVVRVLTIESMIGSWYITYEKLNNAVIGETTVFYEKPHETAGPDISVTLNGELLTFDVPPRLIDNRTMVPLRKIFEAMGADVDWNNDTKTVTATKNNEIVIATINSKTVFINGETKELDVPPMIVDDRTLVPVRFVAESFGANVTWDGTTKTVIIITKWDGTGEIPYYIDAPTVPDFGRIVGLPDLGSSATGPAYSYDASRLSAEDITDYLSLLQSIGYHVQAGGAVISCSKGRTYIDIWGTGGRLEILITT